MLDKPMARRALAALGVLAATAAGTVAYTIAAAPSHAATSCSAGYVALTFDDGPNSNTTTLINTLKTAGVRATLFNIGQNAQNNSSLVKAEASAGMWIGNHSYTHAHLTTLTSAQMQSELSKTQTVIKQYGGTAPTIFRPPYGETNATLKSVATSLGLTQVTWTVDSQDWNGATTSSIVNASNSLAAGGIMLMHDGYQTTIQAIPQIVSKLSARGLCAGKISASTGKAVAP